jgi:hypothetical protein
MSQQFQQRHHPRGSRDEFKATLQDAEVALAAGNLNGAYEHFKRLVAMTHDLSYHQQDMAVFQARLLQAILAVLDDSMRRAETYAMDQDFTAAVTTLNQVLAVARDVKSHMPFDTPDTERLARIGELAEMNLGKSIRSQENRSFMLAFGAAYDGPPPRLTPEFLVREVAPYLDALARIQAFADRAAGRPPNDVRIRALTQSSPISVSLDGAAEAVEVIQDVVVPWKREHAKTLAQLDEQEKIVQIEKHKAEVLETRARAHRERSEAKRIDAEIEPRLTQAQLDRYVLETERLRLEIEEKKIGLAMTILEKLALTLDDNQKQALCVQLLRPLGVITDSPLLMESRSSNA